MGTLIEDCIKSNIPLIVYGRIGSGKTSKVYATAKRMKYRIIEFNMSNRRKKEDLKRVRKQYYCRSLVNTVFLFDEVERMEKEGFLVLSDMVKERKHPVVFTSDTLYSIPKDIVKKSKTLKVALTRREEAKELAKLNKKVNFDRLSGDFRHDRIRYDFNSDSYIKKTKLLIVDDIFEKKQIEDIGLIYLIDNIENFYSPRNYYDVLKVLTVFGMCKRQEILKHIPKGRGMAEYPYYINKKNEYHR